MNFDGYSIGGTSVGEDKETMYRMIDYSIKYLPKDKPRYLMGVGAVNDILEGIERGLICLIVSCRQNAPDMEH